MKKRLSPVVITQLLSRTICQVADRNKTVGKNLMVISLPKKKPTLIKLPNGQNAIFTPYGQPSQENTSFYYLSEKKERIEYGPNTVSYGVFTTDFKHEFVEGEERFSVIPGFTNLK
jgi:hypothetical protein